MASGPLPPTSGEDLPLDPNLLKVLAADSRRDILRLLNERRMTLTEMSARLGLKKATVLEHLKRLTEADLIRRKEDERLWVYYELTPRGQRIVSPGRTRFYLLMGVAAAAALLAGSLVTAAILLPGVQQEGTSAGEPTTGTGALAPGPLSLAPTQEPLDAPHGWLLTPAQHAAFDGDVPDGAPALRVLARDGGALRLAYDARAPPGSYHAYLLDDAGEPRPIGQTTLPAFHLAAPAQAWRGVDDDVALRVDRAGVPMEGELRVGGATIIPVRDGAAALDAAALDALPAASLRAEFRPEGGADWLRVDGALAVRDPTLTLWPLQARAGGNATLHLTVLGPRVEDVSVRVAGEDAQPERADGRTATLALPPLPEGEVEVRLGRLETRGVDVLPDLRLRLDRDGGAFALSATDASGAPRGNVTFALADAALGATDASGALRFAPPSPGEHVLSYRTVEDAEEARALVFGADGGVRESPARLTLQDARAEPDGTGVVMRARLVNEGGSPARATIVALHDGEARAAALVDVPPHGEAPVALRVADAPAWTSALELRVLAPPPAPLVLPAPFTGDAAWDGTWTNASAVPRVVAPTVTPATTAPSDAAGMPTPAPAVPGPSLALVAVALVAAALAARRRKG